MKGCFGVNSFLTGWGNDLKKLPVGPLGVIAMAGCEEMGKKINNWLQKWNMLQETQDEEFFTVSGVNRDSFLIKTYCPRFGTGESKGVVKESVRGYDIYILIDVCAYNKTYKMYGQEETETPATARPAPTTPMMESPATRPEAYRVPELLS